MLIRFFLALRSAGLTPGVGEFLQLLAALRAGLARGSIDEFHALARMALVKDETRFDLFDRVFGAWFAGVDALAPDLLAELPQDWLRRQAELTLTDEEKARIESLGGWDELMRTLRERLRSRRSATRAAIAEIGTARHLALRHAGFNPEGVRIGREGRHRRAVKVWERREFRNLDDERQLGRATSRCAAAAAALGARGRGGRARPARHHRAHRGARHIDVRLPAGAAQRDQGPALLDIGGSMDEHVRSAESLFSAARSEFQPPRALLFPQLPLRGVWRDNRRRRSECQPLRSAAQVSGRLTGDLRRRRRMSPQEILLPGGSVEHHNEEPGAAWMQRLLAVYHCAVWLNPSPSGLAARRPRSASSRS